MFHFLAVIPWGGTVLHPGDAVTVTSSSGISFIVTITLANQMAWRNPGDGAGAFPFMHRFPK